MILLQYHARPKASPSKPDDIAGAYINCWINSDDQDDAEHRASKLMSENGWTEMELDDAFHVDRSDYEENEGQLQYFEQALIDDEVLVVYTYPLVDKDEE